MMSAGVSMMTAGVSMMSAGVNSSKDAIILFIHIILQITYDL